MTDIFNVVVWLSAVAWMNECFTVPCIACLIIPSKSVIINLYYGIVPGLCEQEGGGRRGGVKTSRNVHIVVPPQMGMARVRSKIKVTLSVQRYM